MSNESRHWELFYKKGAMICVFAWEFEMFWIVQPQLRKRAVCSVKNMSLCLRY